MSELIRIEDDFVRLGKQASYHYADESGVEWHLGDKNRDAALQIYHDNPAVRGRLDALAAGFLWALTMEYPRWKKFNKVEDH